MTLGDVIVASAGDAIIALDVDGLVVEWNPGCAALFGWTAEEMLGRGAEALLPVECREELHRVLGALGGECEDAALETVCLHKSGTRLPVSCRLSRMHDRDGQVFGVSAVVRDNSRETELRRQLEQARHLAEARFEQSVVAQATLTPDGVITEVNPALCALAGCEPRQLLGRRVAEFVSESDVEVAEAGLLEVASGGSPRIARPRLLRHSAGHMVETCLSVFAVRADDGEVLRLEVVIQDVSEIAAAERELRLREARWQSLVLHSSDVALFCDREGKLLFVSNASQRVFGYLPEEIAEADGWGFVHPDDVDGANAVWAATVAAPLGTTETFALRLLHADGSWRWAEESVTNRLDDPDIGAMVVNLVDITERKAAEAVLEELAGMDTLTGLASRAPLMAALDAAFASGLAESTAVAVLDVTRLKLINDTYGHRGGDQVLIELASRLQQAVDGRGIVARIGGDLFAAMLPNVSHVSEVFEAAATLLAVTDEPVTFGPHHVRAAVTVGAALGPAVDSGALLASAEAAMLTAKEGLAGPMHVVRAESASAALCRARLIEDLRRGLEQDEFVVHFQPVIGLVDGRPVGAEALVRWQHPDKGLLSPGAFIHVAEDCGLIIDIGQVVLREACRAAARWAGVAGAGAAGAGGRRFHVAVNLSATQLTRGGVVEVVRAALAESGASAENLVLEVTESAVMSDVDSAVRTLQELRDLGVAIAVDDFGTGYSSLTYLRQFPVTALKIDRSFVNGLGKNGDDAAIVTSVINLAKAMELECIAEGVETDQQRLVLQALGCTLGQGFLWSPGLPTDSFELWLGTAMTSPDPARAIGRGATVRRSGRKGAASGGRSNLNLRLDVDVDVRRRVSDLASAGASLSTIAAALNAERRLTTEGRRWTPTSVGQLLTTLPHARL